MPLLAAAALAAVHDLLPNAGTCQASLVTFAADLLTDLYGPIRHTRVLRQRLQPRTRLLNYICVGCASSCPGFLTNTPFIACMTLRAFSSCFRFRASISWRFRSNSASWPPLESTSSAWS